ncbi:MAG TPA: hypothetical protein VMC84_10775 [Methanocella sp.]|uniref:hypothetical protein n=1 Tax=Methanocella sp. TaxID=2052833 RepID=UPI002D034F97|nr:hypothetical protein [Methanocella sp.]HTY91649.1 hypothetical protein [Methanocella sp.]
MRKIGVALVILLLLAFFTASQAGFAMTTSNILGQTSIGKSKATLNDIQKKLTSGSSDIAKQSQLMDAYAKYMAKQTMGNVTKNINTGKKAAKATIKAPSTAGMSVPTQGIGDAIKALGNVEVSMKSPASMAKGMQMPKLAVMK